MESVMQLPLTPQQRTLVKRTFTHIAPNHDIVARLFYDMLFEIAPELRPMFTHSMDMQRAKVMQMLAALVAAMDDPSHFSRISRELGKRHIEYGVIKDQYALVGRALMWALEEACPDVMNAAALDAWNAAYAMMADAATDVYK
jgi:hemoglobin-like flavoprotein